MDDERTRAGSHAADSRRDSMTEAQKKAVAEFARRAQDRHLRSVRADAAQSRGDEPRARDGRLPALQQRAAAAPERVRDSDHRARLDAELRVGRAQPRSRCRAGCRPTSSRRSPRDAGPTRMADDEEVLYTFCDELHRNQSVSDATYARAVATFGEQGVIDIVGISGLLHAAGDGPEHRAHAAARRTHAGARAVSTLTQSRLDVDEPAAFGCVSGTRPNSVSDLTQSAATS